MYANRRIAQIESTPSSSQPERGDGRCGHGVLGGKIHPKQGSGLGLRRHGVLAMKSGCVSGMEMRYSKIRLFIISRNDASIAREARYMNMHD